MCSERLSGPETLCFALGILLLNSRSLNSLTPPKSPPGRPRPPPPPAEATTFKRRSAGAFVSNDCGVCPSAPTACLISAPALPPELVVSLAIAAHLEVLASSQQRCVCAGVLLPANSLLLPLWVNRELVLFLLAAPSAVMPIFSAGTLPAKSDLSLSSPVARVRSPFSEALTDVLPVPVPCPDVWAKRSNLLDR